MHDTLAFALASCLWAEQRLVDTDSRFSRGTVDV